VEEYAPIDEVNPDDGNTTAAEMPKIPRRRRARR
jgi:hypothetical protein